MENPHARISLVIVTHNRAAELLRTVASTLRLPECPPVLVVDNASSDDSIEWLRRRFPGVRSIRLHANLGAAARNIGALNVATPYVAFCDDDVTWAPGALSRAVELLDAHPRVAALTARVLVGHDRREDPACAAMAASPLTFAGLPGPAVLGFLAGASVFRREAFLAVGGYEPRFFIGGEERLVAVDLAVRGWSLAYADQLIAHHYPSAARDGKTRGRLEVRNALWTAWLRQPARNALRRTVFVLRRARLGNALAGGFAALRGIPWVLRHRRVVPAHVASLYHLIDTTEENGGAVNRHAPGRVSMPVPSSRPS
jgi:GT2 family glycosyltransferase